MYKTRVEVSNKYTDFANIFFTKLTVKVFKHMAMNDHIIKLVDNWKPSYDLIYSLGMVELETLKTYI